MKVGLFVEKEPETYTISDSFFEPNPVRLGFSFRSSFSLCLCDSSLCFLGSSQSGLCLGFCSSFALLSQFSGFRLVLFYLLCQKSLLSGEFLSLLLSSDLAVLCILLSLPCLEFLLSGCLVECTLLHAAEQVLHQEYTFAGEDVLGSIGRLCTYAYPVQSTLKIEVHRCGVGVRVVRSNTFDKLAITWRTAVCYYDVVVSIVFMTMTSQTNLCCHLFCLVLWAADYTNPYPG